MIDEWSLSVSVRDCLTVLSSFVQRQNEPTWVLAEFVVSVELASELVRVPAVLGALQFALLLSIRVSLVVALRLVKRYIRWVALLDHPEREDHHQRCRMRMSRKCFETCMICMEMVTILMSYRDAFLSMRCLLSSSICRLMVMCCMRLASRV